MNGVTDLEIGLFVGEVLGTYGTLWLAGLVRGRGWRQGVLVSLGVTLLFLGFFVRTCLHCYQLFGGGWPWIWFLVVVGFSGFWAMKARHYSV